MSGSPVVDAVVAWVDGSDPSHARKLAHWRRASSEHGAPGREAVAPLRFRSHSEIVYCVRSIRAHAPWVRTIWLVTDDQFPAQFDAAAIEDHGIRLVSHRHIFRGLEAYLPTFNSGAIESLIWRIEGLAEHFIYFNDDMFLANPMSSRAFFKGDKVILRGHRTDWSRLARTAPYILAQLNAAKLAGQDLSNLFVPGHVPHPMLRSTMAELFEAHSAVFHHNASLRFRTGTRVHPVALMNFALIDAGKAITRSRKRIAYIGAGPCKTLDATALAREMDRIEEPHIFSFCINDFGELAAKLPDLHARMRRIVGPAGPWELDGASVGPDPRSAAACHLQQ